MNYKTPFKVAETIDGSGDTDIKIWEIFDADNKYIGEGFSKNESKFIVTALNHYYGSHEDFEEWWKENHSPILSGGFSSNERRIAKSTCKDLWLLKEGECQRLRDEKAQENEQFIKTVNKGIDINIELDKTIDKLTAENKKQERDLELLQDKNTEYVKENVALTAETDKEDLFKSLKWEIDQHISAIDVLKSQIETLKQGKLDIITQIKGIVFRDMNANMRMIDLEKWLKEL